MNETSTSTRSNAVPQSPIDANQLYEGDAPTKEAVDSARRFKLQPKEFSRHTIAAHHVGVIANLDGG